MWIALDELEWKINLDEANPDGFDSDVSEEKQDDPIESETKNDFE